MTNYDIYVFILCSIVFVLLTAILGGMLVVLVKQMHKLIRHGIEDEKIKIEYEKEKNHSSFSRVICTILSAVMLTAIFAAFAFSIYVHVAEDRVTGDIAVPKVVLSNSMSKKHRNNTYLTENGLDDQFQMFDLIYTHKLPAEEDLELYDIVVYEYEDKLIIHRIIHIEEPNAKHPDCRYFLLRGDAAKFSDEFPVLYEQMVAIYRGQRIPFIGSFFAFMQSPAGYLCILLVVFAVIATPIAEKKLWEAKLARLRAIGYIPSEDGGNAENPQADVKEEDSGSQAEDN